MRVGSISTIAIITLILIVLICGIILLVVVSLQKTSSSVPVKTNINTSSLGAKPISANLILDFPQCFDISTDAKNVYKIMKNSNLDKKYSKLLDAYSLALCQQKDFKNACDVKTLDQRIITLNSWNANQYNNDAAAIVNSVTKIKNNKLGQFLVQVCDICEKQTNAINSDDNVMRDDKIQITGFNSQFYRNHFDTINKSCPDVK